MSINGKRILGIPRNIFFKDMARCFSNMEMSIACHQKESLITSMFSIFILICFSKDFDSSVFISLYNMTRVIVVKNPNYSINGFATFIIRPIVF